MRTFTFSEGSSNKFWSIDLQGAGFTVTFGRIGAKGQAQLKSFPSEAAASKEHDKLVAEKLKKGYVESAAVPARPSPLRDSLERALDESPDDLASHMAYADLLSEEGDPHGEFIQLQLRLEDRGVPPDERRKLKAREKQLLKQHEREWLGGLAEYVLDDYVADLDDAINALAGTGSKNHIQLQRLKKRKLALRDQIAKLESELLPDIIA